MMAAMAFRGIPAEAFDFYEGLEADNSKAYWTEHKAMYDEVVKQPFVELLAEVEDEFGAGKIFRPNRDVRFSNDKTPYKTNIGAIAVKDGAVSYVSLSRDGLFAGSGFYRMDKEPLDRFRRAVADDRTGPEIEALVAKAEKAGYTVGGEALKRAPKLRPRPPEGAPAPPQGPLPRAVLRAGSVDGHAQGARPHHEGVAWRRPGERLADHQRRRVGRAGGLSDSRCGS
jgi:uncharacterized protein (TIGR02453 family)